MAGYWQASTYSGLFGICRDPFLWGEYQTFLHYYIAAFEISSTDIVHGGNLAIKLHLMILNR